ncbi:hypothetical protein [Actinoallomurus rhizosphaericola]|uniref:hypothetical protein n=1 Tax=Actinoallomurus rhizosphaericola TaxID=2952536 RepID=UPI0020907276|nr:hypothetical protein [Actinoallomurus rhizosphaericola]MCO5992245.1 hypothetical protein [Actinoallomurus rhizosphaericola]
MVLIGCGSSGVRTTAYGRTASPSAGAQRRITVPGSFDDYTRMTGPDAERVIQAIRDAQAKQNAAYAAKMRIGIYERRGNAQQRIAFLGLAAGDHPDIAKELRANPPSFEVDSALAAMPLTGPKDYPPGPLGGVLRCAAGAQGGAGCAWGDGSTLGVVAGSAASADELAKTALALRTAAER